MKKSIHVVPSGASWKVKSGGRTLSTHYKQSTAVKTAIPLAKKAQTELVMHRVNGQIRSKDSYGADPMPPKDREH